MKKIFLLFVTSIMLLAIRLDITGNVTLVLNMDEKTYSKGIYEVKNISNICFEKGDASVIINGNLKLNKNSEIACYQLPLKKETSFMSILSNMGSNLYSLFIDTGNIQRNNSSIRGVKYSTSLKNIHIPIDKKFYIIKLNKFFELPIVLKIKNTKGEIIKQHKSSIKNEIIFIIKTSILKNDYRLIIESLKYDITYMDSNVVLKK